MPDRGCQKTPVRIWGKNGVREPLPDIRKKNNRFNLLKDAQRPPFERKHSKYVSLFKQINTLILLVLRHHGRLCNAVARLPGSFDVDVAELAHVEFLQEFATCAPGRFFTPRHLTMTPSDIRTIFHIYSFISNS